MGEEGDSLDLELEADTLRRVSSSISAIEAALAEWEASKKPEFLEEDTEFLRMSHGLLSAWCRESLTGSRDPRSARERLRRFADMCRKIDGLRKI
jgi:hypothetical protein